MLIKYAYVENVPGLSSGKYMDSFDDGEYLNHVEGQSGFPLLPGVNDALKRIQSGGKQCLPYSCIQDGVAVVEH